jgi:hypothetical protein
MSCRYQFIPSRHTFGCPIGAYTNGATGVNVYTMNDTTQKLAVRFRATDSAAITHVDLQFNWVGDTSGTQFRIGVFADSSGKPGSTQLGGYTDNFYGISGGTGSRAWCSGSGDELALSTDTGSLTVGSYYWLVLEYVSGTLDSSNYVVLQRVSANRVSSSTYAAYYNGSSWATAGDYVVPIYIRDANGDSDGFVTPLASESGTTISLYGTTRYAWKAYLRMNVTVRYASCRIGGVTGSPPSLMLSIFENNTYKGQVTVTSAYYNGDPIKLPSPISLTAGNYVYAVMAVDGSGGNASNYYRFYALRMGNRHAARLYWGCDDVAFGTFTGHASDETQDTPHTSFAEEPNCYLHGNHPIDILMVGKDDLSIPSGGGGGGGGLPILRPSIVR